jgi:hypothetical protein
VVAVSCCSGLLIHAALGSTGGAGGCRTKRWGWDGVGDIENLGAVSADRVGAAVVDIGGCVERDAGVRQGMSWGGGKPFDELLPQRTTWPTAKKGRRRLSILGPTAKKWRSSTPSPRAPQSTRTPSRVRIDAPDSVPWLVHS